ncbi:MAG: hypothetical protein FK733_13750 [Asgard group archaeon]|nr:hypothetical protein [Asgard group archaeon]
MDIVPIDEQVASIPDKPGVYFFFDIEDEILYIGKSVSLKKRITDHFRGKNPKHFKIVKQKYNRTKRKYPMYTWDYFTKFKDDVRESVIYNKERKKKVNIVSRTTTIKYIVTDNDAEAFTLEGCLISAFRPLINRAYWSYPFVEITTHEEIPRVKISTFIIDPRSYLFGPFNVDSDINIAIRGFLKVIPVCDYDNELKIGGRYPQSCLREQLHKCLAPCKNKECNMEDYQKLVEEFTYELENLGEGVLKKLEIMMNTEVQNENFEAAACIRDEIQAIKKALVRKAIPTVLKKYYDKVLDVIGNKEEFVQVMDKILDNNNG